MITRIMKKNDADFDFQFRVRKYLKYCYQEENEREKEEKIFNKLSKTIKDEYHYQTYGKKFLNLPFFKNNFSFQSIISMGKLIKKIDLGPEEHFIKRLEIKNTNFYLLFKGEIEFSIPSNKPKFPVFKSILQPNNCFNEIAFLVDQPQFFDVKTLTFCTFYTICRNDFINLLKNDFPDDYEKFCFIKDSIILEKDYKHLFKPCGSCKNLDHKIEECPFLHFIANADLIIKKNSYTQPNERQQGFLRKRRIHVNAIFEKSKLKKIRSKSKKTMITLNIEQYLKGNRMKRRKTFTGNLFDEEDNLSFDEKTSNNSESFYVKSSSPSPKKRREKAKNEIQIEIQNSKQDEESKDLLDGNFENKIDESEGTTTEINHIEMNNDISEETKNGIKSPDLDKKSPTKLKRGSTKTTYKKLAKMKELNEKVKANEKFERFKSEQMFQNRTDFNQEFLANLLHKKKTFISKNIKTPEFLELGMDLFNFNFETPKVYRIYHPENNVDNNLKKFKRVLRKKEKRKKLMRT